MPVGSIREQIILDVSVNDRASNRLRAIGTNLNKIAGHSGSIDQASRALQKNTTATNANAESKTKATKRASGFRNEIGQVMRRVAAYTAVLGTMVLAYKAVSTGVSEASNLVEAQNKNFELFGAANSKIEEAMKKSNIQLGISRAEATSGTAAFGAFFTTLGYGKSAAVDLGLEFQQMSADWASFYNIDTLQAQEKLLSGLSGQVRAVRSLGVNLYANNVERKLEEMGIAKVRGEYTLYEKVMARVELLREQSAKSTGDFIRTSHEFANQMRITEANAKDLARTLFGPLKEGLTSVMQLFNSTFSSEREKDVAKFQQNLYQMAVEAAKISGMERSDLVAQYMALMEMVNSKDINVNNMKLFVDELIRMEESGANMQGMEFWQVAQQGANALAEEINALTMQTTWYNISNSELAMRGEEGLKLYDRQTEAAQNYVESVGSQIDAMVQAGIISKDTIVTNEILRAGLVSLGLEEKKIDRIIQQHTRAKQFNRIATKESDAANRENTSGIRGLMQAFSDANVTSDQYRAGLFAQATTTRDLTESQIRARTTSHDFARTVNYTKGELEIANVSATAIANTYLSMEEAAQRAASGNYNLAAALAMVHKQESQRALWASGIIDPLNPMTAQGEADNANAAAAVARAAALNAANSKLFDRNRKGGGSSGDNRKSRDDAIASARVRALRLVGNRGIADAYARRVADEWSMTGGRWNRKGASELTYNAQGYTAAESMLQDMQENKARVDQGDNSQARANAIASAKKRALSTSGGDQMAALNYAQLVSEEWEKVDGRWQRKSASQLSFNIKGLTKAEAYMQDMQKYATDFGGDDPILAEKVRLQQMGLNRTQIASVIGSYDPNLKGNALLRARFRGGGRTHYETLVDRAQEKNQSQSQVSSSMQGLQREKNDLERQWQVMTGTTGYNAYKAVVRRAFARYYNFLDHLRGATTPERVSHFTTEVRTLFNEVRSLVRAAEELNKEEARLKEKADKERIKGIEKTEKERLREEEKQAKAQVSFANSLESTRVSHLQAGYSDVAGLLSLWRREYGLEEYQKRAIRNSSGRTPYEEALYQEQISKKQRQSSAKVSARQSSDAVKSSNTQANALERTRVSHLQSGYGNLDELLRLYESEYGLEEREKKALRNSEGRTPYEQALHNAKIQQKLRGDAEPPSPRGTSSTSVSKVSSQASSPRPAYSGGAGSYSGSLDGVRFELELDDETTLTGTIRRIANEEITERIA